MSVDTAEAHVGEDVKSEVKPDVVTEAEVKQDVAQVETVTDEKQADVIADTPKEEQLETVVKDDAAETVKKDEPEAKGGGDSHAKETNGVENVSVSMLTNWCTTDRV